MIKNNIKIEQPTESVIDLEQMSVDEKIKNLNESDARIDLKQERINDAKKISDKNGINDIKKTFDIIDRVNIDNISHVIVFLKITDKDKEKLEEIKITDYKIGMKVSWESNNKLLIGVIVKIDKNTNKIQVKEYESTIKIVKFYKLEIINDEEYKFIIDQTNLVTEAIDEPEDKPIDLREDEGNLIPDEEDNPDLVPKEIKKLTIKDFKKDMKVSWKDKKGNILTGVIELIKPKSKKNINILDDNGKSKIIPFTNLTIINEVDEAPVEVAPVEVAPVEPVIITTGDNVKWTDKTGKELTGSVRSKTLKNYIICCKKDNTTWRIPINWPSLMKI